MSASTKSALGAALVITLIVGLGTAFYALCDTRNSTSWYTQVDNEHVVAKDRGEYGYALEAYDENGAHRQIAFGTERVLREGAYLKLSDMPIRGVVAWEEVQLEEIPEKARIEAGFANA